MNLKLVYENVEHTDGFGAGGGEYIREEYECPCGKGRVVYTKDDIPGFRDSDIYCRCEECKGKYEFGRGTADEKGNE